MTWHWASKKMPPPNTPVWLAWRNADNEYARECTAKVIANKDGTKWIILTTDGDYYSFDVEPGDKWSYIELPE